MKSKFSRLEVDDSKRRNVDLEKTNQEFGKKLQDANRKIEEMKVKLEEARNPASVLNPTVKGPSSEYDVVVKIDSMSDLSTKSWAVTCSKRYEEGVNHEKTLVVAVSGLSNKGKTFLTNKLCDGNFKSGFHIKTEGIPMVAGTKMVKVSLIVGHRRL
eukprot:TRINITY_DN3886_c0_g1_i1.p4 TRINITY_DN3886_c0_g1~~TRINITY_DN3886_c0_g1_i1.p4  ORF type:complete len:157 (+),score=23.45 TRINITY_DN3886_c0_g1_i1:324-794(+)